MLSYWHDSSGRLYLSVSAKSIKINLEVDISNMWHVWTSIIPVGVETLELIGNGSDRHRECNPDNLKEDK